MADAQTATPSYLEMSDEDMLKTLNAPVAVEAADTEQKVEDEAKDEGADATSDTTAEDKDEDEAGDAGAEDAATAPAGDADEADATKAESEDAADAGKDTKTEGPPAETKAEGGIDFEAEYKKLLAPFKANGREITVKSVDDAIVLMQMGANYNKKMAALKPNLKLMKLLENNGLLSEEKLSYLIDLEKKDPQAINKLVKDSGINPMDLDAEKAGDYKPKTHTVDDREIDLDSVLEEIQDSPTYSKVIQVVGKQWDGASKQAIANAPQLLRVINDHMASGVYDLISAEVESERVFGRLKGLSDIEAYRQVGDAIQARGGFDHLFSKKETKGQTSTAAPVSAQPKPKKPEDPKLNDKRRAASPTKAAPPSTMPADFNPLAMSDEEFAKQAKPWFR